MKKYIFKRLFLVPFMVLAVSFIIFFMLRLNGSDAVLSYLNASGTPPTKDAIEHARAMLGLDKPLFTQYILWLENAIKFDFGTSYITGRDVGSDMVYYFKNSLNLVLLALCFTLSMSLILGVISAVFKDKIADFIIRFISFLGVCTPNFWLGFILISVFSVKFSLLPPFGSGSFLHLIMPAFAMSFMSMAISARLIRANMLENINARHVMYAKTRGIKGLGLINRHILRNSLLPIVTAIGMHFGELIGAAIVVENVFAYPGIGTFIITAIISNDYPIILAFMLFMSVVFIISNLIIDICYVLIDPRVRLGFK